MEGSELSLVSTELYIYVSADIADGSSETVDDLRVLIDRKILAITIVPDTIGWELDLLVSFIEKVKRLSGSATVLEIDDSYVIEPKGNSYFIFSSSPAWKLTNNGGSTAKYSVFIDLVV